MNEINNISNLLETNVNQLKKLVESKRIKTNEYIQATEITCMTAGHIMKNVYISQEKANVMKAVIDKETMKIAEARARSLMNKDIRDIENILATTQEQFDQRKKEMQEELAKEKSKLKHEIQYMAEKEEKQKEILEREIRYMKKKVAKEKSKIDNEIKKLMGEIKRISGQIQHMRNEKRRKKNELDEMQKKKVTEKRILIKELETLTIELDMVRKSQDNIRSLKQQQAELREETEAKKNEMKLYETQVKDSIENLQNILNINKDQNVKIKNIEQMQIKFAKTKEEYEKNIQVIQQFKVDRQRQIEAEIQRMKEEEAQAKIDLEETIQTLQNTLVLDRDKIKNPIPMKQREALVKSEIETNVEEMRNKLADEENSIVCLQQKEAEKRNHMLQNPEVMQQCEHDKKKEIESKIKRRFMSNKTKRM